MKVSIIIPIYNTEKYIAETLDSLINQTLSDIEIICVNDGSTDGTLEILERYAQSDNRIVVVTQPNSGQSVARNLGIKLAKGEYIGFLDSDDWFEPDALEKLYSVAQGNDIGICSINVCAEGEKKDDDFYLSLNLFPKSLDDKVFTHKDCADFLFRICVVPWNKLYRREFLEKHQIKFPVGINFEDNNFFLETFLLAESIRLIREPLVCYRVDSLISYSKRGDDRKKLDFFKVLKRQQEFLASYPEYSEQFLFHKRATLSYWFGRVKNLRVKLIYAFLLTLNYPLFIFSPILKPIKTYLKLAFFPKDTYFWGGGFCPKYMKALGLRTRKVGMNNLTQLPPEANVVALTRGIYKYHLYVERILRENGCKNKVIECVLPLW